ncbi:MAG: hypothetical protein OSB43_05845 [Nocardioides sp.]|uniref:hypothetical protein n=1 Tax=Nocardioides sp. TaxID=35761 RepID=UPI00238AF518|nr:hypothetical protein [Nocardioides sp.]MDE0775773.1 hypothetical protein [Nocardioides sp.]
MKHPIALVAACTLIALGLGPGVSALAGAAEDLGAPARERPVIVEVDGDAANGFGITYADGEALFPPTDSEARAECSEHDARLARVRCRVGVRTWYRDLGDLQRSLAYAAEHGR